MQGELSADELAELLGSSREEVEALRTAGLLDPEGDGAFDDLDLVRAQVVKDYFDQGFDPESLASAIRDGSVAPFLGDLVFDQGPRFSLEEAAAKSGVEPQQVRALLTALGLPRDELRERDLGLLDAFQTFEAAGFQWEAILEGARVFGDTLRRLADTEARLVHVHIHERLLAEGVPEREVSRQVFGLQESVAPLLDPLILHIHREHLLRAQIEDAYLHLVTATSGLDTIGAVEAAIAFIDVASFTELTQEKGDRFVGALITRLDEVVRREALQYGGKLVKEIGDAFMLAFRDSVDAVRFAGKVMAAAEEDPEMPKIRIGINCGSVLFHSGDYTGAVVNLASRVTNSAMAGQILFTEEIADAATKAGIGVEQLGARLLRGVDKATVLFRVTDQQRKRDPICGKDVPSPPAARLSRDGTEYWFCSEECLRRFFQDETVSV